MPTVTKSRTTVTWVLGITLAGLIFDGYDLVVYGAVMPALRRPGGLIFEALTPAQQEALTASAGVEPGQLTDAMREAIAAASTLGGALGSYALFGMLIGALATGFVGDRIGRRIPMLVSLAWLSIGMGLTAMAPTAAVLGVLRFLTGLGIGALVATTAAVVSEFAPRGRKNLANAVVYSGVPLGSTLAALAAILWLDGIGWRGLFWIGTLPLVTLLPLAWWKLPESVAWLWARGRHDDVRRVAERTGIPVPDDPMWPQANPTRGGFRGLFSGRLWLATITLGLLSATGLLMVYSLNTWLPQLTKPLLGERSALALLLALNLGAVVGGLAGSTLADRFGAKRVIATFFAVGAAGILLATTTATPNLAGLMIAVIGVVGLGTSGTQTLIYGFVANYYPTTSRAAATAWCAGFGRLGGVAGPIVGGLLAATFPGSLAAVFLVLAGICLCGVVFALLVPNRPEA